MVLAACGRAAVAPKIRLDGGRIRVDGLPERDRRRLIDGNGGRVRVIVESGPPDSTLPSLAGRWEPRDSGIVFIPRFEPTGGIDLVVSIDTAGLAGRRGAGLVRRFPIPASPAAPAQTEVTIYP